VAIGRIDQIRKATGDFRKNMAIIAKNMNVEKKDWHSSVESHEKGVAFDVAIKLLITRKKQTSKHKIDDVMKPNLELFLPILVRFLPIFMRLLPIFIRVFLIFERFIPVFVSYFLERSLRGLKTEGSIDDYRTRTLRTGKFHYRIDIRIVLTAKQAKNILNDLVTKIPKIFDGSKN
jgi:hypothetical protein